MVPGMLATLLDYNFVNACVLELEIDGNNTATAIKEIDGGRETLSNFDYRLVL